MSTGGQAPQQHGEEEGPFYPHLVDQPALQQKADRVADLEPEVDVGVVHRRPAHFLGQHGLHDAERGTVDVVQGGGEEHQGKHAPTGFADAERAAKLVADRTRVHPGCGGGDLGVVHKLLVS